MKFHLNWEHFHFHIFQKFSKIYNVKRIFTQQFEIQGKHYQFEIFGKMFQN